MATDIIAIASGNPINEKRAYVNARPDGGAYLLIKKAPSECDTIAEIESKYQDRFEEQIIVGG
jgi:hypothetical protein